MELIIKPEDKKQLDLLRKLFKAMRLNFESREESPYDPDFVNKIKRGERAMKEGKGVKVDLNTLWK